MNHEINTSTTKFIYDLYDNIGTGKRVLNDILESIEERTQEEDVIDSIVFVITIEQIAKYIKYMTYSIQGDEIARQAIKNEIVNSLDMPVPYNEEFTYKSFTQYKNYTLPSIIYKEYEKGISNIIDLYLNDKDITKSEHYEDVLHFLVKKIYIRGH